MVNGRMSCHGGAKYHHAACFVRFARRRGPFKLKVWITASSLGVDVHRLRDFFCVDFFTMEQGAGVHAGVLALVCTRWNVSFVPCICKVSESSTQGFYLSLKACILLLEALV